MVISKLKSSRPSTQVPGMRSHKFFEGLRLQGPKKVRLWLRLTSGLSGVGPGWVGWWRLTMLPKRVNRLYGLTWTLFTYEKTKFSTQNPLKCTIFMSQIQKFSWKGAVSRPGIYKRNNFPPVTPLLGLVVLQCTKRCWRKFQGIFIFIPFSSLIIKVF